MLLSPCRNFYCGFLCCILSNVSCEGWSLDSLRLSPLSWQPTLGLNSNREAKSEAQYASRRSMLLHFLGSSAAIAGSSFGMPSSALATPPSTLEVKITDRIFLEVKGLARSSDAAVVSEPKRIVIGLFGNDAPESVSMLKQLVSQVGLQAPCKPKEPRMLQREQLEASKVYNGCIESQERGVTYDLSTVWRILKDERIDVGSVSGKYISREYPTWEGHNSLMNDAPGTVSVLRGTESGFGFTIYPGGSNANDLDENQIVVGRVIEGMDVIEAVNQVPVVASAKLNYMALAGTTTKSAPNRSCRYGGPMYCNENKPLQKLSIVKTGIL